MRQYLKAMRTSLKFTQKQVAQKLGIKSNYYNMIENGNRQKRMDIQIASKLADVFGVPLELILTEESQLHSTANVS